MMTSSIASLADVELDSDCPVCLDSFTPPVYQCNNGHLICQVCENHCPQCPVCRETMPRKKIRNIAFEKVLNGFTNIDGPCPNHNEGCSLKMKKNDVENHRLDCVFEKKNLCFLLGMSCNETYSTSGLNDMISHFMFDHYLQGSIENNNNNTAIQDFQTDDFDDDVFPTQTSTLAPSPSSSLSSTTRHRHSQLELSQKCTIRELSQYLATSQWTKPNFIRYDDKMFFVKKNVNSYGKFATIVVLIDGSLVTAEKYYATIEVTSVDNEGSLDLDASVFQFKQANIHLLSKSGQLNFTSAEAGRLQYCKIPFQKLETCINSSSMGRNQNQYMNLSLKLNWKVHVTIFKKSGSSSMSIPVPCPVPERRPEQFGFGSSNTRINSNSTSSSSASTARQLQEIPSNPQRLNSISTRAATNFATIRGTSHPRSSSTSASVSSFRPRANATRKRYLFRAEESGYRRRHGIGQSQQELYPGIEVRRREGALDTMDGIPPGTSSSWNDLFTHVTQPLLDLTNSMFATTVTPTTTFTPRTSGNPENPESRARAQSSSAAMTGRAFEEYLNQLQGSGISMNELREIYSNHAVFDSEDEDEGHSEASD